MRKDLSLYESRILAVLMEKEITTPEQYPLSLNALVNACNQKSNRHPVLSLDENTVADTLETLKQQGLVAGDSYKSRVEKYRHRFCNTEFGELRLSPAQLAVVCELMLRGAQTPGELRSRASRMHPFTAVSEVESTLQELQQHDKGPLVAMLPREPGRRESRYMHLFSGDEGLAEAVPETSGSRAAKDAENDRLKQRIAQLEAENAELKRRLRQLGEVC